MNRHLSAATAAGTPDDVAPAWDGDNEQWWDWYMSLAENDAPPTLVDVPETDLGPLPDDAAVAAELEDPYELPADAVGAFAADGFVVLPEVVSPGAAEVLRRRVLGLLGEPGPDSGLRAREMLWLEDPLVRAAVLSPRIAGIAAELLQVETLRLYHDSALCKEPGAGRTPWHHDAQHFPLASHDVVSTWMPLQAVPAAMGPLSFARGMDTWRLLDGLAFDKVGTSYDRRVSEALRDAGVAVHERPFALGDVSFHSTLCFHTAGANATTRARVVLGATYFADGTRLVEHPTMVSGDWRLFVPDTDPGQIAASPHNPVVTGPADAAVRRRARSARALS